MARRALKVRWDFTTCRRRKVARARGNIRCKALLGDNKDDDGSIRRPTISLSDITKGKKMASGNFGDVFEATLENDGKSEPVVIKEFKNPWFIGRDVESFYRSELSMLRRLNKCNGVVQFLGVVGGKLQACRRKCRI